MRINRFVPALVAFPTAIAPATAAGETPVLAVKQATYLSAQLRESVGYLRDAGWRETASLLTVAAEEIEQLRARVIDLERHSPGSERSQPRPNAGALNPTASDARVM